MLWCEHLKHSHHPLVFTTDFSPIHLPSIHDIHVKTLKTPNHLKTSNRAGSWKAVLILAESERRKPIYSKYAACFLMKEWASNRKLKQMRKQISNWRHSVCKYV